MNDIVLPLSCWCLLAVLWAAGALAWLLLVRASAQADRDAARAAADREEPWVL